MIALQILQLAYEVTWINTLVSNRVHSATRVAVSNMLASVYRLCSITLDTVVE